MLALEGGMPRELLGAASGEDMRPFIEKGFKGDQRLVLANPALFRDLKYKIMVEPDLEAPASDNLKRAINLELYDRAIQNPLTNQDTVTRDLLFGSYDKTKTDTDKYMGRQPAVAEGAQGAQPPSVLNKLFGRGDQGQRTQQTSQLGRAARA